MAACTRCKGTGHYSYCPRYGTTCFRCDGNGIDPSIVDGREISLAERIRQDVLQTVPQLAEKPGRSHCEHHGETLVNQFGRCKFCFNEQTAYFWQCHHEYKAELQENIRGGYY